MKRQPTQDDIKVWANTPIAIKLVEEKDEKSGETKFVPQWQRFETKTGMREHLEGRAETYKLTKVGPKSFVLTEVEA